MKLSAEKTNESLDNDELSFVSGTQEKIKSKRRILNPFKRLSLKRTKSNTANRYSLFKSESDYDYENKVPSMPKPIYARSNPFHSDTNLPFATTCTSKTIHSVVFFPSESTETPQYEFPDEKQQQNLIFNPSDLPDITQYEKNNSPLDIARRNLVESKANQTSFDKKCSIVPTNFISDTNNNLNISLTLGLKEINDIVNYLQENELHLKRLISKYIRDQNFEEALLQAVTAHAKVQIDNERKAHKLALDMFSQDLDSKNIKVKALQNSLETVVQINRLLEEEIENLKLEHEKIVIDYNPESSNCGYHKRYEEDMLRNNNELRLRVKHLINEFKKLEDDLKSMQTQNEFLANELATANSQIRSLKDTVKKSLGDHEIEQAALMKQLETNEQIIKTSIEAGDTLMEDLESIKRQLKQMPFSLNWPKLKCRGCSVVDLLHLARACINELCRELINTYLQITVKSKESESQNLELVKLNQELQNTKRSDVELQTKNEEISALQIQIQVLTQRIHLLESESEMYKKDNTAMAEHYFQEKNNVANLTKNVEELTNQISAKDVEIQGLNNKLLEIITENSGLKCNLDSLKKLLDDSKISKVVKELIDTQGKCNEFQAQFFEVQLEKANLIDLSKKFETERENFLKYQQSYCEHLQLQQKEIEDLTKEINKLKEQLRIEQEIVKEKNIQLFQQIQESNIMKTVQSQYTTELSKNQILESNAMNTNFEMNRLNVVAEYNNIVSQQLKEAVHNKDKVICELKSNIDILSNAGRKSMEEKSSLCQELTEASHIIKQLEMNYKHEKEKTQQLTNEKANLHRDASIKIEELHRMLLDERQAIRELFNDHKNLTTQRNNLLSQQKEFLAQMESLKENQQNLKLNQDQFETKCQKYEEQCENLTKQLRDANRKTEAMSQKIKNDAVEYENKLSLRDCLIENMKTEKEKSNSTIIFLQNNLKKLQNEIDNLRTSELNYKQELKNNLDCVKELQERIDEQKKYLRQCSEVQKELEQKLSDALICNNELLNEYNKYMKDNKAKEENLLKELKNYKKLNETKTRSIECLAKDSKEKIKIIEQTQTECTVLKNNLQNFEEVKQLLEEKSKALETALQNQHESNKNTLNLVTENENCHKKLKEYAHLITLLQSQLEVTNKSREHELEICQKYISKLKNDIKTEKQDMFQDLEELKKKFEEAHQKYVEKCDKYESLKNCFQKISERLAQTITTAVDEKVKRENAETETMTLRNEIENLKLKQDLAKKIIQELKETKSRTKVVLDNSENLQKQLEETKNLYTEAAVQCKTLDFELKEANKKLERLENLVNVEDVAKELDERTKLLQVAEKNAEILEDRLKKMRVQLELTSGINSSLKAEVSLLYRKMQVLEFQKCELTIKYHELESKYNSEKNLNIALKESHQHLLTSICELTKDHVSAQSVSQHAFLPLQ